MVFGLFGGKKAISDDEAREKYNVQIPKYECREFEGFQVRKYQTLSTVECNYEARPEGYDQLGSFTRGFNSLKMPMPQTAPCIMRPVTV